MKEVSYATDIGVRAIVDSLDAVLWLSVKTGDPSLRYNSRWCCVVINYKSDHLH